MSPASPGQQSSESQGVSPVVGVILVVAITVALSAVIGMTVIEFGAGSSDDDTRAGVSVEGDTIQLVDPGNVDEIQVRNDTGATVATISTVGGSYSVPDDGNYTVVAVSGESERVIQSVEVAPNEVSGGEFVDSEYADEWSHRLDITVTNPNDAALSDHQVKLSLSHRAEMTSDFSDLRFEQNGQRLDYWVESYTADSQATVWVEVPSVPANDAAKIYAYYGNSSASSASDGNATFLAFDDFERSSFGPEYTTDQTASGGTFEIVDGVAHVFSRQNSYQNGQYWKLTYTGETVSAPYEYHVRYHDKQTSENQGLATDLFTLANKSDARSGPNIRYRNRMAGTGETRVSDGHSGVSDTTSTTVDARDWTDVTITAADGDVGMTEDDGSNTHSIDLSGSTLPTDPQYPFAGRAYSGYHGSAKLYVDHWYLSAYAAEDPTVTVGTAENAD